MYGNPNNRLLNTAVVERENKHEKNTDNVLLSYFIDLSKFFIT